MNKRKCRECKIQKNPEEFTVDRYRHDGLRTICKPCYAAYYRKYRRSTGETIRDKRGRPRLRTDQSTSRTGAYTSQADPLYHDFAVRGQIYLPDWEDAEVALTC